MKTRLHSTLAALLLGTACLSPAFAAYQGVKGSVTLTVTATSEIGGFFVKDDKVETNPSPTVSIEYDTEWIMNPPGFDPEATNSNYYVRKMTTTVKDFDSTSETDLHPTSIVIDESTKLHTQKLANADFIKALKDRGFASLPNPSDFRLVVIFPAERPEGEETPPALFFVENAAGTSIHYVGREASDFGPGPNNYSPTSRDALFLYLNDGIEAYTYKETTTYKHVRSSDGSTWEFDEDGTTKVSDSFSGKLSAYVNVFPSYYDANTEETIRNGFSYSFNGQLSFSGKLDTLGDTDPANDLYVLGTASLLASASSGHFQGDWNGDYYDTYGLATGGFSILATKKVADIAPYLNVIPSELAWLKDAIIASYTPVSD
jgi:hypothetical protein